MTALTRWNPFAEMEAVQNRLSSFLDSPLVRNGTQLPALIEWSPLIDLIETADEYLIRADLPAMSKDDVSVTVEGNTMILKGTRPFEALPEGAEYVLNERPYGTFTRTFTLPDWANASHVRAEFKHGVLTVSVQKAEQAKARTIAIQGE
jgi:HSP20 family protein